jgi:DNA-binding MarR family transcriptional regulator
MLEKSNPELAQEFFYILKQVARIKWELTPIDGLKPNECDLLGILHLNLNNGTKAIPASELGNQLNITPAAVTHMLNPLEDLGLIKRSKHPEDRRFVLISLTSPGRKLAQELISETYLSLQDLIRFLGETETRQTVQLLARVLGYFSDNSRDKTHSGNPMIDEP